MAVDQAYSDSFLSSVSQLGVPEGFMSAILDTASVNIGAGDQWEALSIPAGTLVTEVGLLIMTAEGATMTIDVGASDPDGFLDGVNGNVANAVYNSLEDGSPAKAGGEYFSSADTIDVTFVNAADTAKVMIWCRYVASKDL